MDRCQECLNETILPTGEDGWLSNQGRAVKQRVEALTDDLAAAAYECLEPEELDEVMTTLDHLAPLLLAAQDLDSL